MSSALRLLAVVLALWGAGVPQALAAVASADACGACEDEAPSGGAPCSAVCACCPAHAAAPVIAPAVAASAAEPRRFAVEAARRAPPRAAAEVFHPPRS